MAVCLAAVLMVVGLFPADRVSAISFAGTFEIQSEAAVLICMDTGDVVYQKYADTQQMPASLVNIMTAVVCLENCENLTEQITADGALYSTFSGYEYPSDLRYALIYEGDKLSVKDLLCAMMLTSSCEASIILADHFGGAGGVSAFVDKMNAKAAELGLSNTVFTNPTGLYDPAQVTTAMDMAQLTVYALNKVPMFRDIATLASYTPSNANTQNHGEEPWSWSHSNLMVQNNSEYYYSGVSGIKTGNLQAYGRNMVLQATGGGNKFLLVTMGAPMYDAEGNSQYYHLEDAATVLDWAFSEIVYADIINVNDAIDEVEVSHADGQDYVIVKPAETVTMLWARSENTNTIQREKVLYENVQAPVKVGDKLGELTLKYGGEQIAKVDLIASQSLERSFWKYNLAMIPGFLHSHWKTVAIVLGAILSLLYIAGCVWVHVRFRRNAWQKPVKGIANPDTKGKPIKRK